MSEPSEDMQRFLVKWREIPFRPLTETQRLEIDRSLHGRAGTLKQRRQRQESGGRHVWFAGATPDSPAKRPRSPARPRKVAAGTSKPAPKKSASARLETRTKPCAGITCETHFGPAEGEKPSAWERRQYCCRACYIASVNARALDERVRTAGDDPVTLRMAYGGPFSREDLLALESRRVVRNVKELLEGWKRAGLIEVIEPTGRPLWGLTALGRARFGQEYD